MSLTDRIDRALAGCAAARRRQRDEQIARGAKVELCEHRATLRKAKRLTPAKIAEGIARDHVKRDPQHYAKVSGKQRGLKAPRIALLMRLGKVRVYLVNATAVRKMTRQEPMAADFTMGTNFAVWNSIVPINELWISDELGPPRDPLELRLTSLHESHETRRMTRDGLSYDDAHNEALKLEEKYRAAKGRGLMAALRREAQAWGRR
jgi:hypothetical protein